MNKKKILYICGSLNQTTQMHKISNELQEHDAYFTPYYSQGYWYIEFTSKFGLMDFSILGGQAKQNTLNYLKENNLNLDDEGKMNDYDLVFTCSDMLIPKNIREKKIILVQEGMTDPENWGYHLVKKFNFPRWFGSTSTTGMSNIYETFCVASEGYKDLFISKGADPKKIVVTGIPNFDNCAKFLKNDFPHKGFVLVATSDMRETFKYENRRKFIERVVEIASGKQIIFKLHPNENYDRAVKEINIYAPGSIVFQKENIDPMIANCDVLITRFSSVVYVGLALGKEVYSDFDLEELKKLLPLQNGGVSASNIANIARKILERMESSKVFYMKNEKTYNRRFMNRIRLKKKFAKVKN
ncbi:MAG: hypothetical protein OQK52_03710 [Ignavibacteriaceae bacterium]|nr:hypothetical protein [Ignavibacteriaceae bacterium]